ncbi:MAG: tripartite tricarboxylate transporter TctB family protein [Rhodospirillaceae bacterium]
MERFNRDVYVAIFLLLFSGVMFWASFDIRQPDYGVLPPSTWPRVILGAFTALTFIYLVQSVKAGQDGASRKLANEPTTVMGWVRYWHNPIICFICFFGFLLLLPYLGMLIDGVLFVFALLTMLGGFDARKAAIHGAIALITVGSMWSLFTYGLNVILPEAQLFQ